MASVLIIDDDPQIRDLWTDILEDEGYEVISAENGSTGVRIVQSRQIDVVVTDIIMPDKDGLETIIEIQSYNPAAKIIAVSGGGEQLKTSFLPVAGALGAVATLQKPVDINEFCDAVSALTP